MLSPFNSLAHSPGIFFLRAFLQAGRTQAPFVARQPPAQTDLLGVEPNFFARDMRRRHIRFFRLMAIRAAGFPYFPGIVIVHDGTRGHRQIEKRCGASASAISARLRAYRASARRCQCATRSPAFFS